MFIQGGKIKSNAASSIFEGEFEDESFHIKHKEAGLLGMCKRSGLKHTNETQFYITTGAPLSFMDNVNVVFGRVISGMHFIQKHIDQLELSNERSANMPVLICSAGAF
jgi:cyclophilin family peptidyl-prolyl cis-trans isomerase